MIVTFYSFKGGVGRSMALVNAAELLADAGYKVIACDWDLEAPGLERYFSEESARILDYRKQPGIIDLLLEYKECLVAPVTKSGAPAEDDEQLRPIGDKGLRVRNPTSYATKASKTQRQSGGWIKLLTAGRRDGEWDARYTEAVRAFDWDEFYAKWAGAAYLDFFRTELEAAADIILVDSRTGVTEAGGVCTHHLADLVVLFSAANDQNVEGTRWMAEILRKPILKEQRGGRNIALLPIASRIDRSADENLLTPFRNRFVSDFSQYLPSELQNLGTFIQQSEIPYIATYSFRESIVARQPPEQRRRELQSAYEVVTEGIVTYGTASKLLGLPLQGSPSLRSVPDTTRVSPLIPKGQFIVVAADGAAGGRDVLEEMLGKVGLDVWSERNAPSEGQSPISSYYEAVERSAGRLLIVNPSVDDLLGDELFLTAEINSILARQARKPDYRALVLMHPGAEGLDSRAPLLRRLPRLKFLSEGLQAQASSIIAMLLPEPALIPEPDMERLRQKIKATSEEDSRFFLGREAELASALAKLKEAIQSRRALIVIAGAVGEGKTALIRGGIIPALRRGLLRPDRRSWKIASVVLAREPLPETLQALRELVTEQASEVKKDQQPSTAPDTSAQIQELLSRVNYSEERLALFVDGIDTVALRHGWQGEETKQFLQLLKSIQTSSADVLVVLSVRSSGVDVLLKDSEGSLTEGDVYALPPMSVEGMRCCLEGTARLLGRLFEAGLVERILSDTQASNVRSRSLRVLLAELCETAHGELLTHQAYTQLGGIEGIALREVDRSLASLTGAPLLASKALITSLIHVRTRKRLSLPQEILLKHVGDLAGSGEALLQLFDWNVLTSLPDVTVTLASDAIVELGIIQQWINEEYDKLKLQADLEDLAQKWMELGRPDNLLPTGNALTRFRDVRITSQASNWLIEAATQAEKKRHKKIVIFGLISTGVFLVLLVLGALGIYQLVRSRTTIARLEEARKVAEGVQLENKSLRADKDKLIQEKAALQAELNTRLSPKALQESETGPSNSEGDASYQDVAPSPPQKTQTDFRPGNSRLPPRIYFETGSAAGVSEIKKLLGVLKDKGFAGEPPKNVSAGLLGYSEVKYYFPEDLEEARLLVKTLQSLGVKNLRPEPRQVVGPSNARPRHFDVWIEPPRAKKD